MKYLALTLLQLVATPTLAQEWTNYNTHDPGVTSGGDPDRPVITGQIPTSEAPGIEHEDIGITNVEQTEEQTSKKKKESGEKGGTQDINIGVGELQETEHNPTDLNTPTQQTEQSEQQEQPEKTSSLIKKIWNFLFGWFR